MSKLDVLFKKVEKLEKNQTKSVVTQTRKKPKVEEKPIKVGNITITESEDSILITGDTFDIRNDFKKLSAKWAGDVKGWKIMRRNIDDYLVFKNDLDNKCGRLQIKEATTSTKSTVVNGTDDNVDMCMIESSSDEED